MASVQPAASVVSISQSNFRYVGDFVYILTGSITVDNNVSILFEGTSGKGIIVAKFQPVYFSTDSPDNPAFRLYFNDIMIQVIVLTHSADYSPYEEVELLLPPLTKFKVDSYNRTDSSNIDVGINFTGRVYGAK